MSFRIEEKILLNSMQNNLLCKFLDENYSTKIHDDRIISSIYFDNKFFQMFKDSEEGCVPRKKIRLRKYSNLSQINHEVKISSIEGRYKTSKIINENDYKKIIKKGIFDNTYGQCYPIIKISYKRKYIKVHTKRITLDTNIEYQDFISKKIVTDKFNQILEIKTSINDDTNQLNINFPFRRVRFSKYSEAIKRLKIKN